MTAKEIIEKDLDTILSHYQIDSGHRPQLLKELCQYFYRSAHNCRDRTAGHIEKLLETFVLDLKNTQIPEYLDKENADDNKVVNGQPHATS